MAGTLRNSPIDDPVTRAAKNLTDSIAAQKKAMSGDSYTARLRSAGKVSEDLRAFRAAKGKTKAERRYGTK